MIVLLGNETWKVPNSFIAAIMPLRHASIITTPPSKVNNRYSTVLSSRIQEELTRQVTDDMITRAKTHLTLAYDTTNSVYHPYKQTRSEHCRIYVFFRENLATLLLPNTNMRQETKPPW